MPPSSPSLKLRHLRNLLPPWQIFTSDDGGACDRYSRFTSERKAFVHLSVLAEAAPQALLTDPDGIYVDATFGRGGHSRRILAALSPKGGSSPLTVILKR